jgi:pimeloyl-ACP methyl ester carboxylesterase
VRLQDTNPEMAGLRNGSCVIGRLLCKALYNPYVRLIITIVLAFCMPLLASSQMFKVTRHQLYLNCQGKPSRFTVVLLAGGGGSTDTWDKVQDPISLFTHVCSYDRQGLGKSDPLGDGVPQSVEQIVIDLEALC